MSRIKSDQEIASDAAKYDTGYCNPMKNKLSGEAKQDAIFDLEDRGYSRTEAEQMIRDAE